MDLPFNDQDTGHVKDIGLDKAPIPDSKLCGGPIQFPYKEVQQEGLGHHCADPSGLDEKMKNDGPIGENSLHEPRPGENIGLLREDSEVSFSIDDAVAIQSIPLGSRKDYKDYNMGAFLPNRLVRYRNVVWLKPSPGYFKVNCDAALDVDWLISRRRIGFGLVI
ncbi:hypothetical protein Q3G72_007528 [Acer saccharum]|nr:hypothetical protein Q3G72_007528 [Acer saccharum]